MWESDRIDRYRREIRSIGRAVTDPDDVAAILSLERDFKRLKADAVRKLNKAGYTNREIARVTGRDEKAVRQWLATYPAPSREKLRASSRKARTEESCATDETHGQDLPHGVVQNLLDQPLPLLRDEESSPPEK